MLENRGFEYHRGVGFSIFSNRSDRELGRGGRYIAGTNVGACEPAAGVTLFMADILDVHNPDQNRERVYVPCGVPFAEAAKLRAQGFATVCGLRAGGDEEARRLGCGRIYTGGRVQPLQLTRS